MAKLKCFVAMAFGHADVDSIYNQVIKKTVNNLDIISVRVDRVTHNDRIDSKIRSEIKKAEFLIADLTYARPSVYWEAGYAERVCPVIYTCRVDHFKRRSEKEDPNETLRVHFDLQNANIIRWSKGSKLDFQRQLKARIKLVTGPLKASKRQADVLTKSRSSFAKKSMVEQVNSAYDIISSSVASAEYYLAPFKERRIFSAEFDPYDHPTEIHQIAQLREKLFETTLIRLFVTFPKVKLEEKYLRDLLIGDYSRLKRKEGMLSADPTVWERLPPHIRKGTRRTIKSIRNVWLLSALDKVPNQRPQKLLTAYRKIGEHKYFFRPRLNSPALVGRMAENDLHFMPTSSEVYFIDEIQSQVELKTYVKEFIKTMETTRITVVKPDVSVILRRQSRQEDAIA